MRYTASVLDESSLTASVATRLLHLLLDADVVFLDSARAVVSSDQLLADCGHDAEELIEAVRGKLPIRGSVSVAHVLDVLRWWTGCDLELRVRGRSALPSPQDSFSRTFGEHALTAVKQLVRLDRQKAVDWLAPRGTRFDRPMLADWLGISAVASGVTERDAAGKRTAVWDDLVPYLGDRPYLFVSYARVDAADVQPIISALAARRVRLWWDQGLQPGVDYAEEIQRRVEGSVGIIVFISERSVAKKAQNWVLQEVVTAADLDREVIPVRLDDCTLPLDWKVVVAHRHIVDATSAERARAINTTVARAEMLGTTANE